MNNPPKAAYTTLAIYCCFFQTKHLIKSVRILIDNKFYDIASANMILATEEFSKISILSELLTSQVSQEKPNDLPTSFKKNFFHHEKKLSIALNFIKKTFLKDSNESDSILQLIEDKSLIKQINELKKNSIYTNLKKNTVICPNHFISRESTETLSVLLSQYEKFLRVSETLLKKIFPNIYSKAEQYHKSDKENLKQFEDEVIYLISRMVPAIRMVFDEAYINKYGLSPLHDPDSKTRVFDLLGDNEAQKKQNLIDLHTRCLLLIESNEEIPKKYF